MPATQDQIVEKCPKPIAESLLRLVSCYTPALRDLLEKDYELLCAPSTGHSKNEAKMNVYAVRKLAYEAVKSITGAHTPFVIGIQVAVALGRLLVPALGMLSIMKRHRISPENHYIVVGEKAALLFTYGRDVFGESVVSLKQRNRCKDTPLIVATSQGDLLGFGRPVRRNGRLLIRNLLDVGWYLRSGV